MDGVLEFVVHFEDDLFRAIPAACPPLLATNAGESVEYTGDGIARGGEVPLEVRELLGRFVDGAAIGSAGWAPVAVRVRRQVQVEEGGVQLAAEQEAALLIPTEGRTVPAAVAGEVTKVLSRVEEFEHPRHDECEFGVGEGIGREHRRLLHREILQVDSR